MATFANEYPGLGLVDRKFKSSVSAPIASVVDVTGCGTKDYVKLGNSANFNFRLGCGKVQPLLNFSWNTTHYNPDTAVTNTRPLTAIQALELYLGDSSALADNDYASGTLSNFTAPNASIGAPEATWSQVGANWVKVYKGDAVGLGATTTTMSMVRYKLLRICGKIVGYKMSSSINQIGFDPNTCEARLIVAGSLSVSKYLRDDKDSAIDYVNNPDLAALLATTTVQPAAVINTSGGVPLSGISEALAKTWFTFNYAENLYAVGTFV